MRRAGDGKMRRPAALVFFLAGLALAACSAPPESRVALSEPGETAYDQRLAGIWYWTDGEGAWYLHISPRKETALLDVVGIGAVFKESDPVRWLRATAHASEIDGVTYYNVKRVAGAGFDYTAPGESPGFIVVRADITGQDALSLSFMRSPMHWPPPGDSLKDSENKGRVRGREVKGRHGDEEVPYLVLDLSRPELVALIRQATPAKIFKEAVCFHRVKAEKEKAKP